MMQSVMEYFISTASGAHFEGKRVLEVGSLNVNGSVRPFILRFFPPSEYIGVDIQEGEFVDIKLPIEQLLAHFGPESFDVVISCEVVEHVHDWRTVIRNMKGVLRPGGAIYLTTRSRGFVYHAFPHDYWRYSLDDLSKIFSDFSILDLRRDPSSFGVFIIATKPRDWSENSLSDIQLYSMVLGKTTVRIPSFDQMPTRRRLDLKLLNSRYPKALLPRFITNRAERRLSA